MLKHIPGVRLNRIVLGAFASLLSWVSLVSAQQAAEDTAPQATPETAAPAAQNQSADDGTEMGEVVVTAYRQSLKLALDQKQKSASAIDMIVAEDIADFPDLNLAEAIQRVPGVSIARDAGEGRQVTVRGLGPQFTRVRINGIEALTTNGGTDAAGGTNRGRNFDFNTFASELFNSITVRKTASAEVEEGSVGATIDLRTGRPFDYKDFTVVTSVQGGYNDINEEISPRAALLISNTFGDGRFGALFSAAYTDRSLADEGSSTVRWQNGGACPATPVGAACFGALGANYAGSGSTATLTDINAAFHPRIPRYDKYVHEQDRLGLTASLQFQPGDSTLISLDGMYSEYNAERNEIFLESHVFSTNGMAGINDVDVQAAEINSTGTLVYGIFDDVDIRSEARFDELSTEFTQVTLDAEHTFSDAVVLHGLAGFAQANHENPVQTTLLFDANNVDGYTYDYRNDDRLPLITYGTADVSNPATWTLSQIRLRPQSSLNTFKTVDGDLEFIMTENFGLKFGGQWKKYEFKTTELRRSNGTTANIEGTIPANVAATPIVDYSELSTFGDGLGVPTGTPTTWLIPDLGTAGSLFNLYDPSVFRMGIEPALGNNNTITEEDRGAWVQFDFSAHLGSLPLRGNVGVRYVETTQESTGYTFTSGTPLLSTVERSYDNTLPSLNMVLEVTDEFLIRLGASKAMTRPPLGNLSPGSVVSVSGNNRTVTAGNPLLEPFESDNYDLGFEWYFAEESLVAVALFYKDIGSFIQTIRSTMPFTGNPLGLPDSVAIAACGTTPGCTPDAPWDFNLPANTPGGEVEGFEISYQQPFTFLPGAFSGFGLILNYTGVESDVQYLDATGAVVTTANLAGLSESAYNATIYFENDRFSARVSAAYRDEYLTTVPGRNGNDVEGTAETLNVDAAASFSLNDNIEFTLEALNLTDEFQDQWVDSNGNRLSYYHHTGREYFLGARFKF